jgi:hypothetical protein
MKLLVSIVVLGLAFQASARVLRILPAPGCEASSILPVEGGDEVVEILPIGGGAGGSILPIAPRPSNKLPPAQETAPISLLPIEAEKPIISLPVLPGSGAEASILPAEPEYIWPTRPGFGGSVPPSSSILPTNPISIMPVVGGDQPAISLPYFPEGSNKLPIPGASNKLPPAGNVNPISILPVAGSEYEYVPVRPIPVRPNPISVLPVESEKPIISLPVLPGSGAGASILPTNPISIMPVVGGDQPAISLPYFPEGSNKLPIPGASNKLPPTVEAPISIAPLPVVYPERPAISPPVVPVLPVAPEDCETNEPVVPEQHIPDKYIIF